MLDKPQIVIMSPHADDEIIGCFSTLMMNKCSVVYTDVNMSNERREETTKLKKYFDIKMQIYMKHVPPMLLDKKNKYYFPDHINEIHYEHRRIGFEGEQMARDGYDVVFYSTIMNVPWIHEVHDSRKEEYLNKVYPSQKSLWEYEKKFVLFEAKYKMIFESNNKFNI